MNSVSFLVVIALVAVTVLPSVVHSWPNFQLYTRKNANDLQTITPLNVTASLFDQRKKVAVLVHGFSDSGATTGLRLVKDALLIAEDMNVIIVDWKIGATGPNYHNAALNTRVTAKKLSEFLASSRIDQSKVHCIGHSLGAHVCGFAGRIQKMKRISGLDPAGPEFSGKWDRLNTTHAEFVDVIHTDGFYGIDYAIGHVDFFPNGGKFQTGCGLFGQYNSVETTTSQDESSSRFNIVEHLSCSHSRVVLFYAESILSSCKFVATPCTDYGNYKRKRCVCSDATPCSYMGYYADQGKPGSFYLDTNKSEPFCQL